MQLEKQPNVYLLTFNFNKTSFKTPLRYPTCEEEHPAAIAPIGSAVHSYSFKTRIEEEDFERTSRGGVAPLEGTYILPEPVKHKYQLLELG